MSLNSRACPGAVAKGATGRGCSATWDFNEVYFQDSDFLVGNPKTSNRSRASRLLAAMASPPSRASDSSFSAYKFSKDSRIIGPRFLS